MLRLPKFTAGRLVSNPYRVHLHDARSSRFTPWALRYSSGGPQPNRPTNYSLAAVVLGSIVSACVGYGFATTRSSGSIDELTLLSTIPAKSDSGLNEQYGSPADFKKAIEELKAAFPQEDVVSTDDEVLQVHGNSDNDYHPGTQ